MVDPEVMCRQHLLGEHFECHMFFGHLARGRSVDGYVKNNLFEGKSLCSRHDALAEEMVSRGYTHRTPMQSLPYRAYLEDGRIDRKLALGELLRRCPECRKRQEEMKIN